MAGTQWDNVLQNLGDWEGCFTQLSPDGTVRQNIPSRISLTSPDRRSIHLVLRRDYPDRPTPHELVFDFDAPGPGALFFESGAFSEGATYFSTTLKFGAEFGFLDRHPTTDQPGDRRLRLVQLFESGRLCQLTLIREKRVGSSAVERPPLTVAALLGQWQAEAITLHPSGALLDRSSFRRELKAIAPDQFLQIEAPDPANPADRPPQPIALTPTGLTYEKAGQHYQTLLLPDGTAATCPLQIQPHHSFDLETSWLLHPTLRQRLIRTYTPTGHWYSTQFITEQKLP